MKRCHHFEEGENNTCGLGLDYKNARECNGWLGWKDAPDCDSYSPYTKEEYNKLINTEENERSFNNIINAAVNIISDEGKIPVDVLCYEPKPIRPNLRLIKK